MAIRGRWVKGQGFIQEEISSGTSDDTIDLGAAGGLTPHMRATVTRNASATLTAADVGITVISGSGDGPTGTLKFTLPDPSSVPLAVFGFRMTDARQHVVTSSGASVKAFAPPSGSFGVGGVGTPQQSSHVTMSAIVGSSALFQSDGLHYLMYAASGTHVFA